MKLTFFAVLGLLAFPTTSATVELERRGALASTSLPSTLTPAQPMQVCVTCMNIMFCYLVMGTNSHTAGGNGAFLGAHEDCQYSPPGPFCSGHYNCYMLNGTEAQAKKLEELATLFGAGEDVVEELSLRFPASVEVISGRGIAVKQCGQIIAFREVDLHRLANVGGLLE